MYIRQLNRYKIETDKTISKVEKNVKYMRRMSMKMQV